MAFKVIAGSDHAGFSLKQTLVDALKQRGVTVEDMGTYDESSCYYPDIAHKVAEKVAQDALSLGLLVCGSGVGMSITANRHRAIRAVVCSESYSAEMARRHNNANIVCLGSRVVGPGLAESIVQSFIAAKFEAGRHARRVDKIEL